MNRLAEVGRVTPCAPSLALQEIVVAVVGVQRTARPTFRFMANLEAIFSALWDHEPLSDRSADAHIREFTHLREGPADVGIRAPMGRFMKRFAASRFHLLSELKIGVSPLKESGHHWL
jgi:hypothetical protein